MGGSSGRGAAQSGAVAARADDCLEARPLGVDDRLRLVHNFRLGCFVGRALRTHFSMRQKRAAARREVGIM